MGLGNAGAHENLAGIEEIRSSSGIAFLAAVDQQGEIGPDKGAHRLAGARCARAGLDDLAVEARGSNDIALPRQQRCEPRLRHQIGRRTGEFDAIQRCRRFKRGARCLGLVAAFLDDGAFGGGPGLEPLGALHLALAHRIEPALAVSQRRQRCGVAVQAAQCGAPQIFALGIEHRAAFLGGHPRVDLRQAAQPGIGAVELLR